MVLVSVEQGQDGAGVSRARAGVISIREGWWNAPSVHYCTINLMNQKDFMLFCVHKHFTKN